MKMKGKIIILSMVSLTLFLMGGFYHVSTSKEFYLFQAAQALGGYPYEIGLVGSVTVPCYATPTTPPVCSGGTLCYVKDPATCLDYSDVSGAMAGGMGMNALFRKDAIAKAGLAPGGELIAGGMSPVLMDTGVLGSAGGCSGCTAKTNKIDRIKEVFDYVIASLKK